MSRCLSSGYPSTAPCCLLLASPCELSASRIYSAASRYATFPSPRFFLLSFSLLAQISKTRTFSFPENCVGIIIPCVNPDPERFGRANLDGCSKSKYLQHQHQFAELGRKKLEQAIQQLQEQLQLNVIQQTHLLQTADKKKASAPLQQLALQQQRLIQQLQITQSQYLLQQGLGLQGHNPSSGKCRKCSQSLTNLFVSSVFFKKLSFFNIALHSQQLETTVTTSETATTFESKSILALPI